MGNLFLKMTLVNLIICSSIQISTDQIEQVVPNEIERGPKTSTIPCNNFDNLTSMQDLLPKNFLQREQFITI